MDVKLADPYGSEYKGKVTRLGRKYAYVTVEWFGGITEENVPFDRRTGQTSQDYQDRTNAIPLHIVREA